MTADRFATALGARRGAGALDADRLLRSIDTAADCETTMRQLNRHPWPWTLAEGTSARQAVIDVSAALYRRSDNPAWTNGQQLWDLLHPFDRTGGVVGIVDVEADEYITHALDTHDEAFTVAAMHKHITSILAYTMSLAASDGGVGRLADSSRWGQLTRAAAGTPYRELTGVDSDPALMTDLNTVIETALRGAPGQAAGHITDTYLQHLLAFQGLTTSPSR